MTLFLSQLMSIQCAWPSHCLSALTGHCITCSPSFCLCPLSVCSQHGTQRDPVYTTVRSLCPVPNSPMICSHRVRVRPLPWLLNIMQSPLPFSCPLTAPASLAFLPPQGICNGSSLCLECSPRISTQIPGTSFGAIFSGRPFPPTLFKAITLLLHASKLLSPPHLHFLQY